VETNPRWNAGCGARVDGGTGPLFVVGSPGHLIKAVQGRRGRGRVLGCDRRARRRARAVGRGEEGRDGVGAVAGDRQAGRGAAGLDRGDRRSAWSGAA
jgi:hypothetical protein